MSDGPFAVCPFCRKERQTTKTGKMKTHNYWNAGTRKMEHCPGSLKPRGQVVGK